MPPDAVERIAGAGAEPKGPLKFLNQLEDALHESRKMARGLLLIGIGMGELGSGDGPVVEDAAEVLLKCLEDAAAAHEALRGAVNAGSAP